MRDTRKTPFTACQKRAVPRLLSGRGFFRADIEDCDDGGGAFGAYVISARIPLDEINSGHVRMLDLLQELCAYGAEGGGE